MDTEKRRTEILRLVQTHGKVKVTELSRIFNVSEVSIRNDLELLEEQGQLHRVHGGAVGKLYINMSVNERYTANADAKKAIAKKAAELIHDNCTVMMNAGTTLVYVLQQLQEEKRENVSIVTNALQNALAANTANCNVTLLGGQLDAKYLFAYGQDTEKQLDEYHAEKCLLSLDGISVEDQLTLYYPNETTVIRKMIEQTKEVIVVADSTKIGAHSFSRVAPLEKINVLITNADADAEEIRKITERGIRVYQV